MIAALPERKRWETVILMNSWRELLERHCKFFEYLFEVVNLKLVQSDEFYSKQSVPPWLFVLRSGKLVFSPLFKILKITTLQKFIFRTNLIKIAILEKFYGNWNHSRTVSLKNVEPANRQLLDRAIAEVDLLASQGNYIRSICVRRARFSDMNWTLELVKISWKNSSLRKWERLFSKIKVYFFGALLIKPSTATRDRLW